MQDLEASDGVASTTDTNTTNTATRMGRSVSNQLRFTQQNRITKPSFTQLKAKFRSRRHVGGLRQRAASTQNLPRSAQAIMTIGYSLEWENRCLYARLGCKSALGRRVVVDRSGRREIVTATAAALILGILVSWGTIYGLNRYLGPSVDPHETTGTWRAPH